MQMRARAIISSLSEISSMFLWAKYQFRRSFVKKDAEFWLKRIEMLKEMI